jgi:hypothetical protein
MEYCGDLDLGSDWLPGEEAAVAVGGGGALSKSIGSSKTAWQPLWTNLAPTEGPEQGMLALIQGVQVGQFWSHWNIRSAVIAT